MAATAAAASRASPVVALSSRGTPSVPIVASTSTLPCTFAALASCGYSGSLCDTSVGGTMPVALEGSSVLPAAAVPATELDALGTPDASAGLCRLPGAKLAACVSLALGCALALFDSGEDQLNRSR